MNEKSNYVVNKYYIDALIEEMEEEKSRVEIEFKQNTNIDISDNKNVLKHVKVDKLNKTALEEQFTKTGDKNIEFVIKYRSLKDKLSKFRGFAKNIKTEIIYERDSFYINPKFKLNEDGGVTIAEPALPFAIDQIQHALRFEYAIPFNSLNEIIEFIRKYKDLFWGSRDTSTFLIKNTTLYATMMDNEMEIMPFAFSVEEEKEVRKLIPEFYNKYKKYKLVEVNFWHYDEEGVKQLKKQWEKDVAEVIDNKIEENIEHDIENNTKVANLEEKNEKNPEAKDIVDIKGQINHVAETLNKFNAVLDKLNAEKHEIIKEEEKKHYVGKIGNIELNYTKKEVLINSFNPAELFFESSNTEELKTNTFYFLSSLTTTFSNIYNYQFILDGLNITASLNIELIEIEEKCTLSLADGQLKII
jgi:hypothetical protein